jgi:hypothetical protein
MSGFSAVPPVADAANDLMRRSPINSDSANRICRTWFAWCLTCVVLQTTGLCRAADGVRPDYSSSHLALSFASNSPAFSWFAVDSLGKGENLDNVVLTARLGAASHVLQTQNSNRFLYRPAGNAAAAPDWEVEVSDRRIVLRSRFTGGTNATAFVLWIDQKKNHVTVLGLPGPSERTLRLPNVLHLPDRGTLRISTGSTNAFLQCDARRRQPDYFVRVGFPAASRERPLVEYTLDVTLIHPNLPGLADHSRYDGYRRNFLNLIQMHPRMRTLANNSSSDVCGFCFWEYSELALQAPPLAPGLTVLDLVRVSLDRVHAGGLTYGQAGYRKSAENPEAAAWSPPHHSLDTLPSFLIAGCQYIQGSRDQAWARSRFDWMLALGRQMLATDKDGNGLIEYPLSGNSGSWTREVTQVRPANWWDTIGFGHEDAYANALAYRACRLMSDVARSLNRNADADEFGAAAEKMRRAYYPVFFNPATGVLAGWRSADGQLHDYWFTFINGMAVSFGLVDAAAANPLMDRMLQKMKEVGFNRFDLGLPGNLVPIRKEDYTDGRKRYGGSTQEDGSDGFQIYENGGATHCHAYWTVKAFYQLGRVQDARALFHPMLQSFREGNFQGFCSNGMSRDWRDWNGGCNGYEGYLTDGYLALLAVEDDLKAAESPAR